MLQFLKFRGPPGSIFSQWRFLCCRHYTIGGLRGEFAGILLRHCSVVLQWELWYISQILYILLGVQLLTCLLFRLTSSWQLEVKRHEPCSVRTDPMPRQRSREEHCLYSWKYPFSLDCCRGVWSVLTEHGSHISVIRQWVLKRPPYCKGDPETSLITTPPIRDPLTKEFPTFFLFLLLSTITPPPPFAVRHPIKETSKFFRPNPSLPPSPYKRD